MNNFISKNLIILFILSLYQYSYSSDPNTIEVDNRTLPDDLDIKLEQVEQLEDDLDDIKSEFEEKCVNQAKNGAPDFAPKIPLPNFIYEHYNIKVFEANYYPKKLNFWGPLNFSNGPAETTNASSGTFTGLWTILPLAADKLNTIPGGTFIVPEYLINNAYVKSVVIEFAKPKELASCPPEPIPIENICPDAWSNFKTTLYDKIGVEINDRNPSSTVSPNPGISFKCNEYEYKVGRTPTTLTTGFDYAKLPTPILIPANADRSPKETLPYATPHRDKTSY